MRILCVLLLLVTAFPAALADTYTVRISPSKGLVLKPGEKATASVTVEPVTLIEHRVLWQSDNEYVASVSSKGVITAHAAGRTTITATIESGDSARINVTVSGNAVTKIAVIDSDIELKRGQSAQMSYAINENADDKRVRWSTDDPAVATVSETGLVTAVGYGTAIITVCAANGMTATASVYVPSEVTSVMLDPAEIMISPGDSAALDAYVFPGNARNRTLLWESEDESIATVDQQGIVTALKEGSCRIRAKTANGTFALTTVIVTKVPKTLSLSHSEVYMTRETRKTDIYPVISPPSSADCELFWESSDESVVTVLNGRLTAQGYGTAVVTVRSKNNLTSECIVTVSEKATGIRFEEEKYLCYANGEPFKAGIAFTPEGAVEKIVSYESSNERVAVIDESGVVTPAGVGSAVIYVETAGGLTARAEISVVEDTREISFPHAAYTMTAGSRMTLTVSAQSQSAVLPALTWQSSVPEVCAVIDGELIAQREGATVITASTQDGLLSCLCQVNVLKNPNLQEKVIALTFDNGPGEYTPEILAALDTFGAPGTFFLMGKSVLKYPEIARMLSDTPHELGNHTYENESLNTSTVAEISSSLAKTDAVILKSTGREATCLRAPDANLSFSLFSTFLDARPFIGWTYKSIDTLKTATVEEVVADALANAHDKAILVFHDQSPLTAEALTQILGELSEEGYRFVTVSELRALTGDTGAVFTTKQ